ncbi:MULTISPECIES: hypothetical protein [Stenotrophomonas]|uniref:hypothetical protein n=1 Tax=Stenotrophomonas TaxID=40323 RepID=UPI000B68EE19|nr:MULTISPECIES: hypothetical protein [Stenotrophomonas]SMR70465.1 hypothetical protein SAMN04487863_1208 [Stenotrophomonas sp. yr243]SNT51800.1 hypothetical protein SAMN05518671_2703 [Stenotrophomonas lactitubi]
MPAALVIPDISIAPAQLRAPQELPDLHAADDDALLRNHVAVARQYHELADQMRALLCSLGSQQGFTVNGAPPRVPAGCIADGSTSAHGPRRP